MYFPTVALALTLVTVTLAASAAKSPQRPLELPLASQVEVRRATSSDSAVFSSIIIAAFKDAPEFKYVHQFFDEYPHDQFDCLNDLLKDALSWPAVMAHLGLVRANEPPRDTVAVSAALWILPDSMRNDSSAAASSTNPISQLNTLSVTIEACKNRDINETRALDYIRQFDGLTKRYLDDVYPEDRQLYLNVIGTLPAYQGHDIAGHLLREGLRSVDDVPDDKLPEALYATLSATVAGEPLYRDNSYTSIKNITIHALDGIGDFRFDIMVKQLRP